MIISAWWNPVSSELKKSKKIQPENLKTKAIPKRIWIRRTHSASTAFLQQEDKDEENKSQSPDLK